jgi:Family of unknown function (DUF5681)
MSEDAETTPLLQQGASDGRVVGRPFLPGQSGNPAGRPKGARHKLGEAFIAAMHADFETHGEKVVAQVREEKPDQYLKVIASILPKELTVNAGPLEEMSDDALADILDTVRALVSAGGLVAIRERGDAASEPE